MKSLLAHILSGRTLTQAQTVEAFELIMTGQASPPQIAALLAMLQFRGPSVDEIAGAAQVMRAKATPVKIPPGLLVLDTCGTGGDHASTFNISTAAALVVAGAGRPRGVGVAKHGNRSVTSQSGSSQVLEALGVKIRVAGETLTRCLDEAGICFCFAPAHHPAMRYALPVRQELGFRTLFNLLGPLTNPAAARRQLMGVFLPELTDPLARVLQSLGSEHAMVVHGQVKNDSRGLDELSIAGPSRVSHLRQGSVTTYELDPQALGLAHGPMQSLRVDTPAASAETIRGIFAGRPGPARDIVCLNAAAALLVADLVEDLPQGLRMAAQTIDSGAAAAALDLLIRITQTDPTPQS